MGTITDKLLYLGETKSDLRATLNGLLGLSLDADTPFRQYAYTADMAAIRKMFSSGELGGYWEPTLGSYYEDSAGSLLAVESGLIGMWLDKSKTDPVVRRNALQNSNDFAGSTWVLSGVTVTPNTETAPDGTMTADTIVVPLVGASIYQITSVYPQKTYTFSFYVKLSTLQPNNFKVVFRNDTAGTFITENAVLSATPIIGSWVRVSASVVIPTGCTSLRSYIHRNVAAGTGEFFVWGAQLELGTTATEYQPITTNAAFAASNWTNNIKAIQATTANKPYLRKTPQTSRYWLDGNTSTANLTATFQNSLGSSCTIARLDPELGVQWSENQTVGTTYNLIAPYAYHGPMLIINRALTTAEKSIVSRVMGRFMPQLGPNIIENGDMEAGLPTTVTVINPAEQVCTRVTNDPKFGSAALALVKTTSNIAQPSVLFPVPQSIAGKQVIAAVKSYSTTSTGTGYALTSWPATGSVSFSSLVVSNQTWRQMRGAGVMPSNATHLRHGVGTVPSYSAGTEVYRLDDVVLREIL